MKHWPNNFRTWPRDPSRHNAAAGPGRNRVHGERPSFHAFASLFAPTFVLRCLIAALLVCTATLAGAANELHLARLSLPAIGLPDSARVMAGDYEAAFTIQGAEALRTDRGAFWLRVLAPASDDASTPAALVVRNARNITVTLFTDHDTEPVALNLYSADYPVARARNELVFALDPGLQARALYLWVEPEPGAISGHIGVAIEDLHAANAASVMHMRVTSFAIGALFALTLSALFIWVAVRDLPYLYFAGTVGFESIWLIYASGEGFAWPVFDLLRTMGSAPGNAAGMFATACLCWFIRAITVVSARERRLVKLLSHLALVFAVLAIVHFVMPAAVLPVLGPISNALILLAVASIMVLLALQWRRGIRGAGYFMLAFLLVAAFVAWGVINQLMGNVAPSLLTYGLPFAIVSTSIVLTIGLADRMREQRHALQDARRRAATDPLTGMLNRRSIVDHLHAVIEEARETNDPVSLLFLDLDHFKRINDTYGHLAGDACLKAMIDPLQAELRQTDAIGRYGGEEFLVVLQGASTSDALAIAERIRMRVAQVLVQHEGAYISITCSIGVASSDATSLQARNLIDEADRAMYAAKHAGRDRVHLAGNSQLAPLV